MPGIERIKITDISNYLKIRTEKAELYSDKIDKIYFQILPLSEGKTVTEVSLSESKGRYDAIEGIDIILTLKDGSRLTLQEKILFTTFNSLTIEEHKSSGKHGAWYYCTSQLYFVAYVNETTKDITSYVLVDLVKLKILSNNDQVKWNIRKNINRGESFRYVFFKDIPPECIISKYGF